MDDRSASSWLNYCIPAGSLLGVRIGVHWIFPVVFVVWSVGAGTESGARWGFAVAGAIALLFVTILAHEFGHVLVSRREGADCDRVTIWPLGGLSFIGEELSGPAEARVAAAGPAMNLAVMLLLVPVLVLAGVRLGPEILDPIHHWYPVPTTGGPASFVAEVLWVLFRLNLIVVLLNLIPAFPLDGGRILRGILEPKWGRVRSVLATTTVSLVVATALFVLAVVFGNLMLGLVALFVGATAWLTRRRVMMHLAEAPEEPNGFLGYDFSMGHTSLGQSARGEDSAARRREERERKEKEEREAHEAEERRVEEEVDRLLEKIHREGMDSLTRKERAFLLKASRRKR